MSASNVAKQDNSYANRLRFLRGKIALRQYKPSPPQALINPGVNNPQSAYATVRDGRILASYKSVSSGGVDLPAPGCCSSCQPPTATVLFVSDQQSPAPPPYDVSYGSYYDISWNPFPGATSYEYSFAAEYGSAHLFVPTGSTSVRAYLGDTYYVTITITGISDCGGSAELQVSGLNPCFLAGSLISLTDGTTRVIEEIQVGDEVIGAFGETNMVLALHRPILGSGQMCRINNEHSTTSHHPHVTTSRGFVCMHPDIVMNSTYGHEHDVINGDGSVSKRMLHGLLPGRVTQIQLGDELKTIEGSRVVSSLELYDLPPDTQLYNLVVGGSHTYHVDGYAVTGWPREDDFDYDEWAPKA